MGEALERIALVSSVAEAQVVSVPDPERVAYITQTTLSMEDTRPIVETLKRRFPKIEGPAKDDICYATQNRQLAVRALARQTPVILVIGSKRSDVVPEGRRREGKVAFVTGASRGIGEAISRRLAADGARVALAARDEEACRRIAREIEAAGGEAIALRCDVTDSRSIAETIGAIVSQWRRIDVLVNNAGLGGPTPLDDPDDSRWDAIIATNLTAVFRVTRAALPHLSEAARIINLSSV